VALVADPAILSRRLRLCGAGRLLGQLALDIPAGRPFRAENRGWLPADAA